jgi:hypothetical protein
MSKPAKFKVRSVADLGFSPEQMAGLVNQAQSIHAPTDFDHEVQHHLDALSPTPADNMGQREEAQSEAISNISESGAPDTTPTPKAKPSQSVADAFKNWDPQSES